MNDNRGLIYSSTLHAVIVVLLIFGLPDFFQRTVDVEPESISVDILPIAPISNVKPQEKAPPAEEKKPVAEKHVEKKAAPETKKEEVKPVEKPVILPTKKIPPKPEKKKEEKKAQEKKQDDLSSILKSVQNEAKAEQGKKPTEVQSTPDAHEAKSEHYDPGAPLSSSEKDAIRGQIEVHWNAPVGAKNASNLEVSLHIDVNPDGTVTAVDFTGDKSRYNSDSFFRAAVDSAIRAVHEASPLKNLPTEKYNVRDGWRSIDMDFDPKDAL